MLSNRGSGVEKQHTDTPFLQRVCLSSIWSTLVATPFLQRSTGWVQAAPPPQSWSVKVRTCMNVQEGVGWVGCPSFLDIAIVGGYAFPPFVRWSGYAFPPFCKQRRALCQHFVQCCGLVCKKPSGYAFPPVVTLFLHDCVCYCFVTIMAMSRGLWLRLSYTGYAFPNLGVEL